MSGSQRTSTVVPDEPELPYLRAFASAVGGLGRPTLTPGNDNPPCTGASATMVQIGSLE